MNHSKTNSDVQKESISPDITERPMMVVDLFSGSYLNEYTGHEALNLEKNKKDGRYYGYCPPKDNINITSLGAPRGVKEIPGVTVIYVKKQRGSNNREVIAFCENAIVHSKCITNKMPTRYLDKKNGYCSYTIESDTMVDLRAEEPKFVIRINDYNNKMFRMQRFYKGTYPKLDKELFEYLKKCLNKKELDDDASFQLEVQAVNESCCTKMGDNSKKEPNFVTGNGCMAVAKNAMVSKQVLLYANYVCAGNHNHVTFETAKGRPYMEGHHLIPCTYSNTKHFWENHGVNIDCQANIVCLCPTCHRQIHYGADTAKQALIKSLYKIKRQELKSVGLILTEEELLKLYSIMPQ